MTESEWDLNGKDLLFLNPKPKDREKEHGPHPYRIEVLAVEAHPPLPALLSTV